MDTADRAQEAEAQQQDDALKAKRAQWMPDLFTVDIRETK